MPIPIDLEDEITSLNSIYASNTLTITSPPDQTPISATLTLPQTPISLSLLIPATYPASPPSLGGITHIDPSLSRGTGNHVLALASTILTDLTTNPPGLGQVILYDFIEALEAQLAQDVHDATAAETEVHETDVSRRSPVVATAQPETDFVPDWILSEPLISHKSTFIARACAVVSPEEASAAVRHLLATDKRVGRATHNMWAYRVRKSSGSAAEVIYADAEDDGEDGAGVKLAALLQAMGACGVLVVVSRWYGGIKLGTERWRLIGSAGREAVVNGGQIGAWIVERM